MYHKKPASQLATMLDDIARGERFSAAALHLAHELSATTEMEKLMIRRWLLGTEYATDHIHLQALANKLRAE